MDGNWTKAGTARFLGWERPTADVLETWIGWRVADVNGSAIGHVEGILRDETRAPAWLIISEFRLGDGRRFVIPVDDAVGGGGHVWSPHPREKIRLSSRVLGPRVTRQSYRRLRAHYGPSVPRAPEAA